MIPKFPLFVTLILGGLLAWQWLTDHVFRSGMLMIGVPLWLILIGLWWALRLKGARLKRLGLFVLGFVVVVTAFRFLVRYEGSADGSAFPSLGWRWQKKASLPELHNIAGTATTTASVPAGVIDMPRFLGPAGDGVLPEPSWQTDWKKHPPREVWRIAMGDGWSGFAVIGNRAITQEQRGKEECVTCYDIATGKLLWSHADEARFDEAMGGIGPRATPTVDVVKGVVFTVGSKGLLNCLDLATGAARWSRETIKEAAAKTNLQWGKSSSPLLVGDFIVCSGGESGLSLIAYRKDKGEIAWKAGEDGGSYSSPVLRTLAGREQIVNVNNGSVTGHDPATGAVLWRFDWPGAFPKVAQPAQITPERLFVTSSYGVKCHLLEIKAGADGKLAATSIWSSSHPRTKFSSASVFGTHAYASDEGTFCCVDLTTGERGWREGRYGFGQQIRVGEQWMLVQAEKGFVALVKANPERLEEVSRLEALSSKTWNPPTLAGRWLLVRNDREAVCYEIPAK
ncbi:PQQ-binding-like beta-propeller repeat protein [Prosthecobacter sp.]|uniref:outer membrane protein assembly factor BamB family protein n=1 Tax=Prosthecobacter sp. TaxID=1965333 RepID=UPI002AB8788E|nr:PQQ-binding-like beta-propeller repeat protein [Prosthecobacter sp.]MDZ4403918.1 PQQ-binding-like beta-propeller repeat protein [Prosthecobacter sp.]